jgi:phosphate:Na+ symporter
MDAQIDWLGLGMGLFGGLALFLFGLDQMAKGLQAAAGEGMKYILARLTRNRVTGALSGALVTAVLNSSSVTTVLVVGFISAGLMTLSQSIGIIMGANIGSTFTAQIIAFDVTRYALGMIAVGFLMLFSAKRDNVRNVGSLVMGLGLVFYGMGVMGTAMGPMRTYQPFMDLMVRMETPLVGILVGAVFTGLVQSSAATTGLAIVLASEGLVSLPAGIALALGANIGTCVTALMAAIGKPREAQRAAAAHIMFNIFGVILWVGFIDQLAALAVRFSPAHTDLQGAARMAADVPRQIANANTIFNVANTVLFLPFTGALAALVTKLLPERPVDETEIVRSKYLDKELLSTPALALERVRLELGHMGEILDVMFRRLFEAFAERNRDGFVEVSKMDDQLDILQGKVVEYLGRIQQGELSDSESGELLTLLSATNYIESLGDVLETSLAAKGQQMLDGNLQVSETMRLALDELGETVARATAAAIDSIRDDSAVDAQRVISYKGDVNRQIEAVLQHQVAKFGLNTSDRVAVFRLEMGIVDSLKRVYTLAKRIAKLSIPTEVLIADQGG